MHETNEEHERRLEFKGLVDWIGDDPERLERVREAATDWQARQLLQDAFGADEYPTPFS